MGRKLKDENGEVIEKGHIIRGVYGIPGRVIVASVREEDGRLFCLTPNHTPKRASVASLIKNLGFVQIVGHVDKRGAKKALAQDYGPRAGSGV